MTEVLNFLQKIIEQYGIIVAIVFLIIILASYVVYILAKNYSAVIKEHLDERVEERHRTHATAASYRKTITPKIRLELDHLAQDLGVDRSLLFEFSNGSSNLVGLPFLYLTATCEVTTHRAPVVSHQYQKLNTTLIAAFLEQLEDKGYFYAESVDDIKKDYPTLYAFMKPNNVKSMLFYTLMGVDDTIGFLVVTTVGDKTFTREETLSKVASSAQIISSLLNFDKIQQTQCIM